MDHYSKQKKGDMMVMKINKEKNKKADPVGSDDQSSQGKPLPMILAEIAYFDALDPAARAKAPQFDQLDPDQKQVFIDQATKYLLYLGKIGLVVQKPVPQKEVEQNREKRLDQLTAVVEVFVKGLKSTKPTIFPYRELACRIMEKWV